MLAILANRTYRHLFLAQVIALVGTGLATVALGLLAYDLAGAEAGAGQRYGVWPLRQALSDYLGRVRGVAADPRQILITGGFEQARTSMARLLRRRGIEELAVEDPGYYDREVWLAAGLKLTPLPWTKTASTLLRSPEAGRRRCCLHPLTNPQPVW